MAALHPAHLHLAASDTRQDFLILPQSPQRNHRVKKPTGLGPFYSWLIPHWARKVGAGVPSLLSPLCHQSPWCSTRGDDAASASRDGCASAKGHTTKLRAGTYKE